MFHHLPHEQPTREGFLQVLDMLQQEKKKKALLTKKCMHWIQEKCSHQIAYETTLKNDTTRTIPKIASRYKILHKQQMRVKNAVEAPQ